MAAHDSQPPAGAAHGAPAESAAEGGASPGAAAGGASITNLLFITSNRIGDAILSSGVLALVMRENPGVAVTIAAGPLAAPLFRGVPGLERVIVLRKRKRGGHWIALWRATVGRRWDAVVDLRGSRTSWFLRAKRRAIAGRPRTDRHKVEEAAAVLKRTPPLKPQSPVIWIDEEARAEAARLLPAAAGLAPIVCLAPAASAPFKMWPAERFASLAQRLTGAHGLTPGAVVAVLGGPGEEALGARALAGLDPTRAVNLAGRSDLLSSAAILERAALFVGNDSGMMHLAAAVGAPTLGLFGPTDETVYGPWGERAAAVRAGARVDAAARKTWRHADHSMMADLTVEQVETAVRGLLAETGGSRDRPAIDDGSEHARHF